jgi:PAS domain S-box-containing protein
MSSSPLDRPRPASSAQACAALSLHQPPADSADQVDWAEDLIQHSRDLLCVHDLEGCLLWVNPGPARLLGFSVEEILKVPMRELLEPAFRDEFETYLRNIRNAGEATGILAVLTREGRRRYWEYHCTLRTRGVEQPVVRGIAHDVTARIEAEKSLRQANETLRKNQEQQESLLQGLQLFRTLLDHSNDSIEVVNPETLRLLDVNEKCCADLGYTREELLSMTVFDIVPQLTRARIAANHQELRTAGCKTLESVYRRKDGSTFPVEVNIQRVQLDREYFVAIARDITERKHHNGRLQEFERVVENLDEMIVVVNREYRYVLANRAFLRYRGMTKDQVVGRRADEVLQAGIFENHVKSKLDECFAGKVINYELKYEYPALGERDLALTYLPIEGPEGIDRAACVLRDITEGKRAAALLEESERRFRAVYTQAPVGIALVDYATGRFLQVNSKYCEIAGRREEELLQLRVQDITHPSDQDKTVSAAKLLFHDGLHHYDLEKRYVRPDGSMVWVNLCVVPMAQRGQETHQVIAIAQDITERRQAEKALRSSEAELREAQRVALMGSWRMDIESQMVTASDQLFRFIGQEPRPEGIAFSDLSLFFLPESWQRIGEATRQAVETGQPKEIEVASTSADGTVRWLLVRGEADIDETARLTSLHGIAIDVTERKQAAEALRASEERLRLAHEAARIGAFERNMQTGEAYWSRETEEMFGLKPGTGPKSREGFLRLIHPADRGHVERLVAESAETGRAAGEWRVIWPDGSVHWIDGRWRVFKDEQGRPLRAIGIDADITDRKNFEEQLRQAKERLTEEKLYLEHEIVTEFGFEDIVGQSAALRSVMESVAKVAASDATVLLLGETGTGKELVARAIHRISQRAANAFIKMNCAAIPTGLLESELFGNEKGAFTGAVGKKIGRLELADKGTLFLDEIGEISLALQPKLLRVLQDQEFERLGGTQTLKVDFRLIAATNRNLAKSVRDKEFRSDLYYRLNVFPIYLPPLRERKDDIPLLVEHFVKKISPRLKKMVTSIPTKTMDALVNWSWPGNVRELENFIERSLILSAGPVLNAPLRELQLANLDHALDETLEAAERSHILKALRESRGLVSGPRGAASRLGLKRTTLQSKLKQLGINPRIPPTSP